MFFLSWNLVKTTDRQTNKQTNGQCSLNFSIEQNWKLLLPLYQIVYDGKKKTREKKKFTTIFHWSIIYYHHQNKNQTKYTHRERWYILLSPNRYFSSVFLISLLFTFCLFVSAHNLLIMFTIDPPIDTKKFLK